MQQLKSCASLISKHRKRFLRYLRERIATDDNPRRFGKPLVRELAGLWRYRVHNYRMICSIEDNVLTVLVVSVSHRRKVYHK